MGNVTLNLRQSGIIWKGRLVAITHIFKDKHPDRPKSSNFSHAVATVWDEECSGWWRFDDNFLRPYKMDWHDLENEEASMLFYRMRQIKPRSEKNRKRSSRSASK